jgi:hypothetical protein
MTLRWMMALALAPACLLQAADAPARPGVLIELFTSEGCSSCPPADQLLERIDKIGQQNGAALIVLSEHVDYWNSDGWTDPYSSAEFSKRQQHYAQRFSDLGVFTPEMIVDGESAFVGSDGRKAEQEIRKAIAEATPDVGITGVARGADGSVSFLLTAHGKKGTHVMVALADARDATQVSRGENAGRTLSHVAVARLLREAGRIGKDGEYRQTVRLAVPPGAGKDGLRIVAFESHGEEGKILGAAEATL